MSIFSNLRCLSSENWQPNMVLDDGGDATHLLVKKFNSIFKVGTFKVFIRMQCFLLFQICFIMLLSHEI